MPALRAAGKRDGLRRYRRSVVGGVDQSVAPPAAPAPARRRHRAWPSGGCGTNRPSSATAGAVRRWRRSTGPARRAAGSAARAPTGCRGAAPLPAGPAPEPPGRPPRRPGGAGRRATRSMAISSSSAVGYEQVPEGAQAQCFGDAARLLQHADHERARRQPAALQLGEQFQAGVRAEARSSSSTSGRSRSMSASAGAGASDSPTTRWPAPSSIERSPSRSSAWASTR